MRVIRQPVIQASERIMPQTLTVSQVTAYIKSIFAADSLLPDVWISGEVSNFKQAASGHCYFTIKDGSACLKSVIWRTAAARFTLPRDGDAVVAHGNVSVYERDGIYQFYIDHLEAAGAGRLWQEFERLRNRLALEGLFDDGRKRPIPARPRRIGVATSASAAALRDILRTLSARYPLASVTLAPCSVQGADAPPAICAAISLLNRWSAQREPLDVIILARGGGSIEELWAFNDERVARAIAASVVPVITGVGHETDFTIADFVADHRAPTPTGAATVCAPDWRELRPAVEALREEAAAIAGARLRAARDDVAALAARSQRASPERRIAGDRQRVDDLARRGALAVSRELDTTRGMLAGVRLQLDALNPIRVLDRGYAIVLRGDNIVASTRDVTPGDAITVRVADGSFDATIQG
jgi:exodeoxyribonuclease VII large subunit